MGLDNEETILGRGGRALAGTSIAVFVVGLPLMKITSIVMGIALAR